MMLLTGLILKNLKATNVELWLCSCFSTAISTILLELPNLNFNFAIVYIVVCWLDKKRVH